MKNIKKIYRYIIAPLAIPTISSAFSLAGSTIKGVIYEVLGIIGLALPILFALCFLVFFWGLSKFILNPGSQADIQKGKSYMMWGVLILFILISFRAIVGIIARDLDIGDSTSIPLIPTSTNSGQDNSTFNLPSGVPGQ